MERAIEYMAAKTGMPRHACEAECYRYEAWPGQACAYKVGEIAIWRMRRAAEEALGTAFDIKVMRPTTCATLMYPLRVNHPTNITNKSFLLPKGLPHCHSWVRPVATGRARGPSPRLGTTCAATAAAAGHGMKIIEHDA